MLPGPSTPRRPRGAVAVLVLPGVLVGVLAAGCSGTDDGDPAAAGSSPPTSSAPATSSSAPSPSPSPLPSPPPPVEATREIEYVSVGPSEQLDVGAAPPADEAAGDRLAGYVGDWLDAHLTDLQDGGEGQLAEVAAPGLLGALSDELAVGATTGLANPESPVSSAEYLLRVQHAGAPLSIEADVITVHRDGSRSTAAFVLVPDGETARLELISAVPG